MHNYCTPVCLHGYQRPSLLGLVVSIIRSIFDVSADSFLGILSLRHVLFSTIPRFRIAASTVLDDHTDFHDIIRITSAYTSYLMGRVFPSLKRVCDRNSRPSYAIVGICVWRANNNVTYIYVMTIVPTDLYRTVFADTWRRIRVVFLLRLFLTGYPMCAPHPRARLFTVTPSDWQCKKKKSKTTIFVLYKCFQN